MNFRFCGFLRGNLKKKKIGGVTFAVGDACPLDIYSLSNNIKQKGDFMKHSDCTQSSRFFLSLFLVSILITLVFGQSFRTSEVAQQIAQSFLIKEKTSPPNKTFSKVNVTNDVNKIIGLNKEKIHSVTDERGSVAAYIQELEPQGFIIISADNSITPVLGFSFNNKFVSNEKAKAPLYDLILADIYARKQLTSSNNQISGQLQTETQWGPWLQTEWYQSGHFNDKCPYIIAGSGLLRRPAGCVAIATGQIVNYWKYPKSISFSSDDDSYLSSDISFFEDASEFGFPSTSELESALSSINYNNNAEEEAYLTFAIGVKVKMDYGITGSGAYSCKAASALKNDLNFGGVLYKHGDLVWENYRDDVIRNMKDGWPVYLGIEKNLFPFMGGHAIVADGYRESDGFFHINLGWELPFLWNLWYNLPNIAGYTLIDEIIFDIAKYQGWNQYASDQRNTFHAIYPAPTSEPQRKWPVNIPSDLSTSTRYTFSHLVIGTGGRIYACLSPSDLGSVYYPYIAIYDRYGSKEKLIPVVHSNINIKYLSQNSIGEVFFSSGTAGPTATDSRVYKLNPRTEEIKPIFTHDSPDAGIFERPIKIDRDDNIYFTIDPRQSANYTRFYSITRTGTIRWSYSFSPSAKFYMSTPAINEDINRVYLNYYDNSTKMSHLIAFQCSNGLVVFDKELPTSTHYASKMASTPSIDQEGTIYVDANNVLFALRSSDGSILWQRTFLWRSASPTPSVGNNGIIYVAYNDKLMALDASSNGVTKWEKQYSLGSTEYLGEVYSAVNGMVLVSYNKDGVSYLDAVKDNGTSPGDMWNIIGGGTIAFGPGRTIVSIPPGYENSIWTLSDQGDRGDPEGLGMNYADNHPPAVPSSPSPANLSTNQDTTIIQLSWSASHPDGRDLKYNIYICALSDSEEAALVPIGNQVTGNSLTLTNLQKGTRYLWAVVASDGQAFTEGPIWSFTTKGISTGLISNETSKGIPDKYKLYQNYPNPFNPITTFKYALPKSSIVTLSIYDLNGRIINKLVNEHKTAGYYSVQWDATCYSSGIYFYQLEAGDFIEVSKCVLIK